MRGEWDEEPEPCDWCQRTSCWHGSRCRYRVSEHIGPVQHCPYCGGGVVDREEGDDGQHLCSLGHTFHPSQYDAILGGQP